MAERLKLTEKQSAFLEALFGEEAKGNLNKAFDIAGYNKDHRNRTRLVKELADEIIECAKVYLATVSAKAVIGLDTVLDKPTGLGNKSTISAANSILDRVGIIKKEQIEVVGPIGGLFILPPKEQPMIDVTNYAKLETTKEA